MTARPASGSAYLNPVVEERLSRPAGDGARETFLLIDGIRCGACALNVERALRELPGVSTAEVNFSTHRARVKWDRSRLKLADILDSVEASGYGARPYDPSRGETGLEAERRRRLRHLLIAGLFGMQIMAISLALYAGDFTGMDNPLRTLLRWAGLVLILPVIAYSATPFLINAVADVRRLRAGMDVPVSLGLLIAFAGSVHATVMGTGDIYFDSVAMFVFFLLLARYAEFGVRAHHARTAESLVTSAPAMATRLREGNQRYSRELVLAESLRPGDRVLVASGDTVPADGCIIAGESTLDESLLTGESRPITKTRGDEVIAGSINFDNPIEISVTRPADETLLAGTLRLMQRARAAKPQAERLADRIAGRFVAGVLLLAAAVALYWSQSAPDRWLAITASVLVVTCPCALSLATPAALTAGVSSMMKRGLIVTRGTAIETLARANRFVFDKTGTLTLGRPSVERVEIHGALGETEAVRIAAALEQNVSHPLACGIRSYCARPPTDANAVVVTPGRGVEGWVNGKRYFLGSTEFVAERLSRPRTGRGCEPSADEIRIMLADDTEELATFVLLDPLRPDAGKVIAALRGMGIGLSLLSGDRARTTDLLAARVGIPEARGDLLPEQKLAEIRRAQSNGYTVAAVGDGINDAPVLAGADVSFAMAGGPHAARASADLISIRDELDNVAAGVAIARRTRAIIRQNLLWALSYNLLAVPAAAMGYVPPWLAAVGMSLSSLIVVANSLRAGHMIAGRTGS